MIKVSGVSAGYGKKKVLHNISADFEKGELTSIIGPNGSGKSTFLKAILGIIPITEGEVTVDGGSISTLKRSEIARRISYLSQGRNIPDMTVGQMVLHGRFPYLNYPGDYTADDRNMAYAAMEKMGIAGLAEQSMLSLSGGMRQNAYIAMALAQDTEYILLDEPTTYLDISHQLELMRILRSLANDGKAIITIMHDLLLSFGFSDRIALINDGRLVSFDTPAEICGSDVIKNTFGVSLNVSESGNEYFYRYRK